jgi:hypothetical protein
MKKIFLALSSVVTLFVFSYLPASALVAEPVTNEKAPKAPALSIPEHAVQVADNVFSLGEAIDPATGDVVEGYAIIHYKKAQEKTGQARKPAGPTSCYTYLAKNAKWKSVEPWVMNTTNTRGLDNETAFSIMQQGVNKWEDATDGLINGITSAEILGNGATTAATLVADETAPDNLNEVYFGHIADTSAIGVTTVWGIFSGPAAQRVLVEWDMVFDDVKFDWSTNGDVNKMDFDNIATHELGHAVGLGDLYNSCTQETMYGYASEGETSKRTLNPGDITGINALY